MSLKSKLGKEFTNIIKNWSSKVKTQTWETNELITKPHSDFMHTTMQSMFPIRKMEPGSKICPVEYHFIYNNAHMLEETLGDDGYDNFQAPPILQRRMWVSGQLDIMKPFPFDKVRNCTESVTSVRLLKDTLFVKIKRELGDDGGVSMVEMRTLVYTSVKFTPNEVNQHVEFENGGVIETSDFFKVSAVSIFRFSALSFNSHKIHYNPEYAKQEGFQDVIVQGPFTITIVMNWFKYKYDLDIKSIKYKNVKPIYPDEQLLIKCQRNSEKFKLFVCNEENVVFVDVDITI